MDYNHNDYELMYLVSEDNEKALEVIIEKYQPVVKKIAYHYLLSCNDIKLEYEDLVQEGEIGLIKAIKAYNSNNKNLFYTFALLCIKRSILSYINKSFTNKNLSLIKAISVDNNSYLDSLIEYNEPLDYVEDNDYYREIVAFKCLLDFKDSLIFELRYNSFTYLEISNLLDISEKEVDNRMLKIRNKLKKYLYSYD